MENLHLSRNPHVGNPVVYSRLAESLVANKTLRELSMDDCDLNDSGMATLLTALQENQTLRVLDLDGNKFTLHGIETVLVPSLPGLNLEMLYLQKKFGDTFYFGNDATEQECDKLVERIVMSLQNNSTLKVLELNYRTRAERTVPSLYPLALQEKRMAAGKPYHSTLDQRVQHYLGAAHRGFNQFWQLRLAENESRRAADRVGPNLGVPLRLLVPRILHRLSQACQLHQLEGDLYLYVRKLAEWGDFGPRRRQGACKRGACF